MDFMSIDEVKQRLGKTDAQLEEMRKGGQLRAFRDGPTWRFRKEDIEALAAAAPPAETKEAGDTLMSIDADILFAEEEEVPADSAAETWIAADTEGVFPAGAAAAEQPRGVTDAMSAPEAEPAPLALSPETDESSLGAVLSEEELGGGADAEGPVIAVDAESGLAQVVPSSGSAAAVAPSRTRIVTLVEPPAHHGEFTFLLAVTAIALAATALVVIFAMTAVGYQANASIVEGGQQMQGVSGSPFLLMALMGSGTTPLVLLVVVGVIAAIAVLIGYVFQKQRAAREALSA